MRLVRKGWHVPCAIVCEGGVWHAIINGEAGREAPDPLYAPGIDRIWTSAERIDEAEYDYLTATREWALANEPRHPAAHPERPIDPNLTPPVRP